MTYVVTEACIRCKYMDCVEVVRSTASTRATTCWSSTPASASIAACASPNARPSDPARHRAGLEKWLEINATYSADWPNLTRKRPSPSDADEHKGEEGKFEKYFSVEPGQGD
jgi:ferredoxin